MENSILCDKCACAQVCSVLMATGGKSSCDDFYSVHTKERKRMTFEEMDKRTANIIWVCKGHHNYDCNTLKEAVAHYMSEECGCPIEVYTDRVLLSIVWEAFMDFMSVCTNPRYFLYSLKEAKYWCDYSSREGVDDTQAILIAFQLCRVRDDEGYVNGFSDELIQYLEEKWDNG